jgi:hypothetical protein
MKGYVEMPAILVNRRTCSMYNKHVYIRDVLCAGDYSNIALFILAAMQEDM